MRRLSLIGVELAEAIPPWCWLLILLPPVCTVCAIVGYRHFPARSACFALLSPSVWPPPRLPSPFLSDESDETLLRLMKLPPGGRCRDGAEGFAGQSLEAVRRWRGNADRGSRPDLTNSLLPNHGRGRIRSCAVVGSSSVLLRSEHGREIDEAEWVIRMNDAPTPAHLRAHVGSRTSIHINVGSTLRMTGEGKPVRTNRLRNGTRVVYYCRGHGAAVANCWSGTAHDDGVVERLSPRLVAWARQSIRTLKWPTSGAMAVAMALHVCDRTRLYGFDGLPPDPTEAVSKAPSSIASECAKYHGSCRSRARYRGDAQGHDWEAEARWIAYLAARL